MPLEFSCHGCGDPEVGYWRDEIGNESQSLYDCYGCFVNYSEEAKAALLLQGVEKDTFSEILRLFSGGFQDKGVYHLIASVDEMLSRNDYDAVDRMTDAFYLHNLEAKYPVACFSLFSATRLAKELLKSRRPYYEIFALHQKKFGNLDAEELAYLEELK